MPGMVASPTNRLLALLDKHHSKMLTSWLEAQAAAGALSSGQIAQDELKDQSHRFLRDLSGGLKSGSADDIMSQGWSTLRELLGEFSRSRALQGFTPSET